MVHLHILKSFADIDEHSSSACFEQPEKTLLANCSLGQMVKINDIFFGHNSGGCSRVENNSCIIRVSILHAFSFEQKYYFQKQQAISTLFFFVFFPQNILSFKGFKSHVINCFLEWRDAIFQFRTQWYQPVLVTVHARLTFQLVHLGGKYNTATNTQTTCRWCTTVYQVGHLTW